MNEPRETANADRYQAIRVLWGISPPAGRKKPSFFTKQLHKVQLFCEKRKTYHAAAGESAVYRVKRPV
jgi:hypothetical protein